jgi:O-antigen/teichoic acid export membrane protein
MQFITAKIINLLAHHFRIDAHYFFSGAVWLTIIQAITVLGALIVSVVFAHLLDETEYGVYRYILGIGALLSSFSLTGIGQSVFQTSAQKHTWFYPLGIKKSLIYSLGITASSMIGSIYYFIQDNTELALGCLLIAILQPLLNTYQQIFPFLQGEKRFRESTILQGIKTAVVTISSLGAIYFTHDIFWLVLTYLLSNTIMNVAAHFIYKPRNVATAEKTIYKRYMDYARNTSVRNIISIIAFRIDSIIIFQQLGAANLAIYTIANILPEHIKTSFKNITTLLVPKYALHDNLDAIKKNLFKRSLQLFSIFVLITIVYIFVAPIAYEILFPKYDDVIFLSQIVALSFPAMIALIPISALQAHTEEKRLDSFNTQTSIFMIAVTIVLTITGGIFGAVLARVISRYVNLFLAYYHFFKVHG